MISAGDGTEHSNNLLSFYRAKHMKLIFALLLLIVTSMSYANDLPPNSHPNISGTGWDCDRGYYKSGQKCVKVVVPENANIDIYGSGWTCNNGFKKSGSSCVPMTQQEIEKQKELERAIAAEN